MSERDDARFAAGYRDGARLAELKALLPPEKAVELEELVTNAFIAGFQTGLDLVSDRIGRK